MVCHAERDRAGQKITNQSATANPDSNRQMANVSILMNAPREDLVTPLPFVETSLDRSHVRVQKEVLAMPGQLDARLEVNAFPIEIVQRPQLVEKAVVLILVLVSVDAELFARLLHIKPFVPVHSVQLVIQGRSVAN
jgi:hypothetical protein